jgi:hypothetical protein
MDVFTKLAALWRAFADEVAGWVAKAYAAMVGKPWFTPAMVETIPDSMLPTVNLAESAPPTTSDPMIRGAVHSVKV